MKAIGKYIVIKPIKDEVESSGVILTAKSEKNVRYLPGVVLTTGKDVQSLKKGDKVYYDKVASSEMRIDEDLYLVLLESGVVVKE